MTDNDACAAALAEMARQMPGVRAQAAVFDNGRKIGVGIWSPGGWRWALKGSAQDPAETVRGLVPHFRAWLDEVGDTAPQTGASYRLPSFQPR